MRLACVLVVCVPLLGQTPQGSPVTKTRGDKVTLEISAHSQPGRAPVVLKWDVYFPAQLMEIEADPEPGGAAKDSGKMLDCTARRPYAYSCTLSGGQKPIADGLIAIYHFKIKATAEAGITRFKIEQVRSTTADSKETILSSTEAIVVIH
jgi:hypothetical protein